MDYYREGKHSSSSLPQRTHQNSKAVTFCKHTLRPLVKSWTISSPMHHTGDIALLWVSIARSLHQPMYRVAVDPNCYKSGSIVVEIHLNLQSLYCFFYFIFVILSGFTYCFPQDIAREVFVAAAKANTDKIFALGKKGRK